MGDGGPGMHCSIVAIWLANLPYRQSTDNAASVNAMVTHWKNRFIWRRYCRKKYQWFGMVCTLIDNDIRQNSGQNCRFAEWTWCKEICRCFSAISEFFIIYERVKKRIQQISWTTPNCNIVVIAKKSEIKNRKKNQTGIDLHIKLPYGDMPGVWTIFTKKRKTKLLVKIRCCLSISSDSKN